MNTGESHLSLTLRAAAPGASRPPPINAFQKHRKLRSRQANRTFGGLRPDKSSSFKIAWQTDTSRLRPTTKASQCRLCVLEKQRRVRRTAAVRAPSAPSHSGHRNHDAYRSPQRRSISSFRCAVRSLAQTLQDRSQQRPISAALHADHHPAWKLDVNRAARCRLALHGNSSSSVGRLTGSREHDWKQRRRCRRRLVQFAPLQRTTPLEHLVRVHTVRTSHQRHTRTGLKGQLRNPPLLRYGPPPADRSYPTCFLCNTHDGIVRLPPNPTPEGNSGFQLPTSWTPIMMPSSMSVSRERPLQMTVLPGGGSWVRAR